MFDSLPLLVEAQSFLKRKNNVNERIQYGQGLSCLV